MELTVNGKPALLDAPVTLLEYLASIGLDKGKAVAELNGEIVRQESFAETRLKDGDVLELVRFVGGG